jgi:hypothetical protein
MTKRFLIILAVIVSFSACNNTNKEQSQETTKEPEKKVLKVNQVMNNPDEYLGKEIKVEGMVTHVCRHGGKRLHLSESGSDLKLRVRTGEKTGKFERELEGSNVTLTGKFVEDRIDQEYIEKLKSGQSDEERHEHGEGDHQHETAEKAEHESQGQGVSEDFIKEMEAKIANSEKGYVSEYWLEAKEMKKK